MIDKEYTKMIICGGGINGIAIVGSLLGFSEKYDLKKINEIVGISIGSVIGLLLIIGYNIKEIVNIFMEINMQDFLDIQVSRLFSDFGLDNGILGLKLLGAMLLNKKIKTDINFEDLYKLGKKDLTICGTNITLGRPEYFNYKNTPKMRVLEAIKISTSFPFIYTPVSYNNYLYIDGGLLAPYPMDYFEDKKEVIGFLIYKDCKSIYKYETSSIEKYYTSLLNIVLDSYLEKFYKGHEENTVLLNKSELINNAMDFSLDNEKKNYLLEKGKDFFNKFYNENLKKIEDKEKKI